MSPKLLLLSLMATLVQFSNSFVAIANTAMQDSISTNEIDSCAVAKKLLQNYQFKEAISALDHCYAEDALNISYLRKKAWCHSKLGELKQAKELYQTIVERDSNNIQAYNQLASIYLKENNKFRSLQQYQKLISIDSTNGYYHKKMANLSLSIGNLQGAIYAYNRAVSLNQRDIESLIGLIKIYNALKLYNTSDSLITRCKNLDSNNVKILSYSIKSLYRRKEYREVVKGVERIFELSHDSSAYHFKLLGISHFREGQYEQSVKALNRVIKQESKAEISHYYLGLAHRELGNTEKSIKHFEKAIDEGVSDNIATYYTNLAVAFEENGEYAESIRAYQAAYKSSKDEILLYHLARNYDAFYKDKKTALKYYEMYMKSNDTTHIAFKDYTKHRISELKNIIHFDVQNSKQEDE